MQQLYIGIMNSFNAGNTFNTAISGRLYAGRVPTQTTYPYCVFDLITASPDHYLNRELLENITIQFTIVSQSTNLTEVNDIQTKLRAWFDNVRLTVTGYTYVNTALSNYFLTQPDEENNIYNYIVDYDIIMSKS